MDVDCKQVALECPECKHFGATHHNALLQPIRRSRPFSLGCGDYLSLPLGHGGYKQVGLYVDVYSGFVWGSTLKNHGTAKSMIDHLLFIKDNYASPDSFMADGPRIIQQYITTPTAPRRALTDSSHNTKVSLWFLIGGKAQSKALSL